MRKTFIIASVLVLIVIIAGGIFAYTYLQNQNPTTTPTGETNTPPAVPTTVDEIRDAAMVYLAANHTGTIMVMDNLVWTGGRQDTGLVGAENYVYTSGSWFCVIDYPVVPNPVYTITLDYSNFDVAVRWMGSYQNGVFCEANASTNGIVSDLSENGIRDLAMMYLKVYHNHTSPFLNGMMSWTGGRMEMDMMIGSDKYNYQSNGWNVTIQNPVVPNPPYTITAIYKPTNMHTAMISWIGTLENGTITQTSYVYSP